MHPPLEESELVITLASSYETGENLLSHNWFYKDDFLAYIIHILVPELCGSHLNMPKEFIPLVDEYFNFRILRSKLIMQSLLNENYLRVICQKLYLEQFLLEQRFHCLQSHHSSFQEQRLPSKRYILLYISPDYFIHVRPKSKLPLCKSPAYHDVHNLSMHLPFFDVMQLFDILLDSLNNLV